MNFSKEMLLKDVGCKKSDDTNGSGFMFHGSNNRIKSEDVIRIWHYQLTKKTCRVAS